MFAAPRILGKLCFILLVVYIFSPYASGNSLKDLDLEIRGLLRNVQSSVVTIQTYRKVNSTTSQTGVYPFNPEYIDTQIGTGVVYDTAGHILTTGHVVRGGNDFEVVSRGGTQLKAVFVGVDPSNDIALLRVAPGQLPPLPMQSDHPVVAGSILFAVGNSFGIPNAANLAVAVGYRDDGSLQVSSNLAPGFSGGPVVDVEGRMVGLIAAKLTEPIGLGALTLVQNTQTGTREYRFDGARAELPSTGVIVAVSASDVENSVNELIVGEKFKRGFLGVRPDDIDPVWAKKAFNVEHGVIISDVLLDSPAWRAGIRSGDILVQYLGRRVFNAEQLRTLIAEGRQGDVVSMIIVRGGKNLNFAVRLTSLQALNNAGLIDGTDMNGDTAAAGSLEEDIPTIIDNQALQFQINQLKIRVRGQMREIDELERLLESRTDSLTKSK
jgi:S1-C subfamily serine protease